MKPRLIRQKKDVSHYNMKLTSNYEQDEITITFIYSDLDIFPKESRTIKANSSLSNLPTKEYDVDDGSIATIEGWYKEKDFITKVDAEMIFTESCNLYAKWSHPIFIVTLDLLDGSYDGEFKNKYEFFRNDYIRFPNEIYNKIKPNTNKIFRKMWAETKEYESLLNELYIGELVDGNFDYRIIEDPYSDISITKNMTLYAVYDIYAIAISDINSSLSERFKIGIAIDNSIKSVSNQYEQNGDYPEWIDWENPRCYFDKEFKNQILINETLAPAYDFYVYNDYDKIGERINWIILYTDGSVASEGGGGNPTWGKYGDTLISTSPISTDEEYGEYDGPVTYWFNEECNNKIPEDLLITRDMEIQDYYYRLLGNELGEGSSNIKFPDIPDNLLASGFLDARIYQGYSNFYGYDPSLIKGSDLEPKDKISRLYGLYYNPHPYMTPEYYDLQWTMKHTFQTSNQIVVRLEYAMDSDESIYESIITNKTGVNFIIPIPARINGAVIYNLYIWDSSERLPYRRALTDDEFDGTIKLSILYDEYSSTVGFSKNKFGSISNGRFFNGEIIEIYNRQLKISGSMSKKPQFVWISIIDDANNFVVMWALGKLTKDTADETIYSYDGLSWMTEEMVNENITYKLSVWEWTQYTTC